MADWLEPVRRLVKPIEEGYFAGVLDISRIPVLGGIKFWPSVQFGVWKSGEHRNWNAIDEWAKNIKKYSKLDLALIAWRIVTNTPIFKTETKKIFLSSID